MKHNRLSTKLMAALLAVLMLTLPACSGSGDSTDTTAAPSTQSTGETTAPVETGPALDQYGREIVEADLPDVKFEGETFTVHTRGNVEKYEWLAEEVTGEALNDAIYKRNNTIEEKYGITLNIVAQGTWSDYNSTTLPQLQASIQANTGAYDLIAGYSSPFANMATTGMLYDLNTLEHIDFDKPWWWQSFNEATEIHGVNYFGLGALSLSAIYSMSCVFFNPALMEEVNTGVDPYQLVLDGKWTWDKMTELSTNANMEMDGDNVMGAGDRWGTVFFSGANIPNMYGVASGEMLSTRDEDGTPVINVNVEKMGTVIDNMIKLIYGNEYTYVASQNDARKMFIDNKALFHSEWLYYAQTQIAPTVEAYGVLPVPKMNEAQENYATWIQGGMHIYSIPIDVKDLERASILTEAFAAETYASLLPAYYEVILKARYFADEASSQMMDIMYDSVSFDFARFYDGQIGIQTTIKDSVTAQQNTFASSFAAFKKVYDKKLTTFLGKVETNAG
ncbi:MAG: extracellular solute-binding protein [Clostridia bacterium]|nr:extracellular solute-binding protein [Clostridia bacterium]